jgi:hypothetical protein
VIDKVSTRRARASRPRPTSSSCGPTKAQEIAAKHQLRPRSPAPAAKYAKDFPKPCNLFTVDELFGGWTKAQKEHFDDGAIYDQILAAAQEVNELPARAEFRLAPVLSATERAIMFLLPRAEAAQRAARLRPGARLHAAVPELHRADPAVGAFLKTFTMTWPAFWDAVTSPRVVASYRLTFGASFAARC